MLGISPSESVSLSSQLRYLQQQHDYDQFDEKLEETHRGYDSDSQLSLNHDFGWHRLQLDTRYRVNRIENDNDRNYAVQSGWGYNAAQSPCLREKSAGKDSPTKSTSPTR